MKRAFTLIEVLVVVLIIGILAAIALPQYQKAVEKSRAAEALMNMRTIVNNVEMQFLTTGNASMDNDAAYNHNGWNVALSGGEWKELPDLGGQVYMTKNFMYLIDDDHSQLWVHRCIGPCSGEADVLYSLYIVYPSTNAGHEYSGCEGITTFGESICKSLGY